MRLIGRFAADDDGGKIGPIFVSLTLEVRSMAFDRARAWEVASMRQAVNPIFGVTTALGCKIIRL